MNYGNPPPYTRPGPTAPGYAPYPQQPNVSYPGLNPAYPNYPVGTAGHYPPPGQPPYQEYPQYGWPNFPPPGPAYVEAPKNMVYVVEERRRDDSGETA
uniref:Cysteine-rich and transmembrane domain-containing protein 1 n=1 Tax=Erpetoichthys calabaricus TaxID=27687 RepID=A0A8C4SU86_ERPCA